MKIVKPLSVILASDANSERSSSALKNFQTCLRTTTGDKRLNHLVALYVHKLETDSLAQTNLCFFDIK